MFSRLTVEPRAKSTQIGDSHVSVFGSVETFTQRQHLHKASARAQNQGQLLSISYDHQWSAWVYLALPCCGATKYLASSEEK